MSAKITIIGTGYVGLVTGACFAELGHDVVCVDKDEAKITMIEGGVVPIYEPGLDELVTKNVEGGRLRFSTDTATNVKGRDAIFIAVGTPTDAGYQRADLRYVFAAAAEIGAELEDFTVVVTKSTVPVGTNRKVRETLAKVARSDDFFEVASNPEFLREGAAIRDFMDPDRVVVGVEDERARRVMDRIYAPLTNAETPLLATGIETAEMIKYAANAFLAIKVSFINEMADLCEAVGADIQDVATGIGLDNRIGGSFLRAGPGWGGSCFPKDARALSSTAESFGVPARIIGAAIEANTARKATMADRIRQAAGGNLEGRHIAVLGLTFKGQTDDMRESPSLEILPRIVAEGATVSAYDPANPREAPRLLPQITHAGDAITAVTDADLVVVMTDWGLFKTYDLSKMAAVMRQPAMLDLRNLFDRTTVLAEGFERYSGLGLGDPLAPTRDTSAANLAGMTGSVR